MYEDHYSLLTPLLKMHLDILQAPEKCGQHISARDNWDMIPIEVWQPARLSMAPAVLVTWRAPGAFDHTALQLSAQLVTPWQSADFWVSGSTLVSFKTTSSQYGLVEISLLHHFWLMSVKESLDTISFHLQLRISHCKLSHESFSNSNCITRVCNTTIALCDISIPETDPPGVLPHCTTEMGTLGWGTTSAVWRCRDDKLDNGGKIIHLTSKATKYVWNVGKPYHYFLFIKK